MNMTQLVLGCALGFIVAQGLLYGLRRLFGGKARSAAADADGKSLSFVRAFIRYAAPVFASAAFILLGAWTLQDYLSARTAPAVAEVPDPVTAAVPQSPPTEASAAVPAADPDAADSGPDPYADADFKVKHHARSGDLKDKLVQHEEQKARAALLAGLHAHAQRSQYDCEAADRAERYLKAGLDVWGFTTWQAKYFPVEKYEGASLAQCQQIQSAIDPAHMNLKSTLARSAHP